MKHSEYADHVKKFTDEMIDTTSKKNPDYSAGTEDAMGNYYEVSNATGVTPVQAWMVLLMKHFTAIMRFTKTGMVSSEAIHGRFIDLANYAMLGDALVKDMIEKGLTNAKDTVGRGEDELHSAAGEKVS